MQTLDRRGMMRGFLLVTAATAAGMTLGAQAGEAMPLSAAPLEPHGAAPAGDMIQKAQVVVVGPRRRRRWVCWWSRGRRVCGWRWF